MDRDAFDMMIKLLDKDGDGTVEKAEFAPVYKKMLEKKNKKEKKTLSDDEYKQEVDKAWDAIDVDKDGNLTVAELAKFYGFDLKKEGEASVGANAMSDDQILEALQMQAMLSEMYEEKEKAIQQEQEKKKEAEEEEASKKGGPVKQRDPTVKRVTLDASSGEDEDKFMRTLLQVCQLGDFKSDDDKKDTVAKCLARIADAKEPKITAALVRVEDDKEKETPLHKLARAKPSNDAGAEVFKKYVKDITNLMKEEGKLYSDVNHQNKDGKTPLYLAMEFKNKAMVDALFDLGADGPDSLLINTNGWTVMHAAVNADDLDMLKHFCEKKLTPSRVKALLNKQDKTGREPLHIAAYKCDEKIVEYLISIGAQNKKADKAGNDASQLAKKAGRRRSREILAGESNASKAPSAAAGAPKAAAAGAPKAAAPA